mgnify:CR=1 FL=1
MEKKALFIIPPDRYNEDELNIPKDALTEAGVEVTVSSTKKGEITGDGKEITESVAIFDEEDMTEYDVIAVIGGTGTIDYLWNNEKLIHYLKDAYSKKILISGICAGACVIAQTGLLKGREGTCYPVDNMIDELKKADVTYLTDHVVKHDDIITSDGPMGAKDFGETLVEVLK